MNPMTAEIASLKGEAKDETSGRRIVVRAGPPATIATAVPVVRPVHPAGDRVSCPVGRPPARPPYRSLASPEAVQPPAALFIFGEGLQLAGVEPDSMTLVAAIYLNAFMADLY